MQSQTSPTRSSQPPAYAVIVKTYAWNVFVARQVSRLAAKVGSGDLWVLVDESRGRVEGIAHGKVLRVTEDDAVAYGLANAKTSDSLFWYCADYLHYLFMDARPDYDHYIFVEHDVAARLDFDAFAVALASEGVDYVGTPLRTPLSAYPWLTGLLKVYAAADLRADLYCFAAFSKRAMQMLAAKRIEMSKNYAAGSLPFWPIGEVFVPTEVRLAGLHERRLEDYGDTTRYDWWPPFLEDDLHSLPTPSFVHPVLEGTSFVRSALRHSRLTDVLRRGSPIHKGLRRYGVKACVPHVLKEVRRRSAESLKRRLERMGMVRRWTAGIEGRHPGASQTPSGR